MYLKNKEHLDQKFESFKVNTNNHQINNEQLNLHNKK